MKKVKNIQGKTKYVPSSNAFIQGMTNACNVAYTENAAITNKSTLSDTLDWFGAGGALRQRNSEEIISLFSRAFAEDQLLALKILFYLRDVREGQGERNTFRIIINWLAQHYPEVIRKNLEHIPFYGRFDDLYSLVGTSLENEMFKFIAQQLKTDFRNMKRGKSVSLLAKWAKSENTSSDESVKLGRKTREALKLSPKRYRKILSSLRNYINVVETKMCLGKWGEINYEGVPSKASLNYRKAFGRHDQERYASYLESVKKGDSKINADAIFPYEIFRSLVKNPECKITPSAQEILQADLQWKSMPNWMGNNEHKGIVIADCSWSMYTGIPNIFVAVSLAIYFAERNVGPFKNVWMTFSTHPSFQKLKGQNLYEKYLNIDRNDWGVSTNLQSSFDLILKTAVKASVPPEDMPEVLYIISDMEFDWACKDNTKTNFQVMREKYETAGYKLPRVVWWNVDARNSNYPIRADDTGTCLVSGCSPSILKTVMSSKIMDPISIMLSTVNIPRYERIAV
jgi:hypothetical protein